MSRPAVPALVVVVSLCLGAGLLLAPQLRAQVPPRVEHRILSWSIADTEAVLRQVTGKDLTTVSQMAHEVAREDVEPVTDARVQAAVDARLTTKLDAAGAEGWEAYFVEDTPTNIEGVLMPAPRVFLRRRS
jgi:hypothetical protein